MDSTASSPPLPGTDATLSMERANVLALLMLPAMVLLTLAPFVLRWGWGPLRVGFDQVFSLWLFLPAFVVCIVVHEGLHLVGFGLFGRAPWSALHVGLHRRSLTPFAGCRVPVRASGYRAAVLLPALVLGVLPLLAGLALGHGGLAVWGCLMLIAAGGDFLVLWAVRAVPGSARVLDHPERVGCRILGGGEAERLG